MDPAISFGKISARAISLGASLAGAARVTTLLESPSHRLYPLDRRVRDACSVVVLALEHAAGQPEMDWWDRQGGRTPGNRLLIRINRRLTNWLKKKYSAEACELPYNAGASGIFLKDAAVLAGLGVLGKNNLLITPQYGPRVRLRALMLDRPLEHTGALESFAPCDACDGPCIRACPQKAFQEGPYQRKRCLRQMQRDETNPIVRQSPVVGMPAEIRIAYCRQCELSCPVGQCKPVK
jgi:epoxyqueuosine reductase